MAVLLRQEGEGCCGVFNTEGELVEAAISMLRSGARSRRRSHWGPVELITEWDYRHGRADILLRTRTGALIAIEAKLTRWQSACEQAYRNTAYATSAYVLLPASVAERALRYRSRFDDMQIGLCALSADCLDVLIEAPVVTPLMRWVTDLAHSTFDGLKDAGRQSRRNRASGLCNA